MTLDFIDQLSEHVKGMKLGYPIKVGALDVEDSISVYALPGGRIIQKYFDDTVDKLLNYEFAIKTTKHKAAVAALDTLAQELPEAEIPSSNGSYEFRKIEVSSEPFSSDRDEKFYYYRLAITAELTTYKQEEQQ